MSSSPLNLSNSPKFPFSNNANFHQHGQIFLLLPESAAIISWPLAFTGKGGWFPKFFFFFNVLISIQRSRDHCNFPSYTSLDSVPIHPPLPSLYCPLPSAVPAPSTFMTYIVYDTLSFLPPVHLDHLLLLVALFSLSTHPLQSGFQTWEKEWYSSSWTWLIGPSIVISSSTHLPLNVTTEFFFANTQNSIVYMY